MKNAKRAIYPARLAVLLLVCIIISGCMASEVDALLEEIVNAQKGRAATSSAHSATGDDFSINPDGEGELSFSSALENEVLSLVNAERKSLNLSALTEDEVLKETARARCKEMLEYNHFEHTRPDGREWASIMDEYGYRYSVISENLQKGRSATLDAQRIFDSWKESKAHYEALIASDITNTGIGVYVRKSDMGYEWYATEHFSVPR